MDSLHRGGRRKWIVWGVLIALSVLAVLVSFWLTDAPPPSRIKLATGAAKGGYDTFGHQYQERLKAMGLQVELVNTNGAVDNLERLLKGEVDVAFVQAGTYQLVDDPEHMLRGLAAVYLEPLWVFYIGDKTVDTLADFSGKRISVGPPRSGTDAVCRQMLKAHAINESKVENLSNADAAQRLKDKTLDVAMMVGSYEDRAIDGLLHDKNIKLMSFKRDVAYSREFRYLTPLKVAAGVLDLRDDIPSNDVVLLAPAALLVCRNDLHPRVVEQILKTAQSVHQQGGKLDGGKTFPTLDGLDLPADLAAENYLRTGESFLSRVLPYWAVRLAVQLKIFVLPLILLWIPAFKLLPALYQMRINMLLKRHYTELREVETELVQATTPADLRHRLQLLDALRKNMERISRKVPGLYQREVYHWRLHVALVRNEAVERLQRLEARGGVPSVESINYSSAHVGVPFPGRPSE